MLLAMRQLNSTGDLTALGGGGFNTNKGILLNWCAFSSTTSMQLSTNMQLTPVV